MEILDAQLAAHYLAEARAEALAETDPGDRLWLHRAGFVEGDTAAAAAAIAAYHEMPLGDERVGYNDSPTMRKLHCGRFLGRALGNAGDFEQAYALATDAEIIDPREATSLKIELLGMGYTGHNDELLDMFDEDSLFTISPTGEKPHFGTHHVQRFLEALAKNGIDITTPGSLPAVLRRQLETRRSDNATYPFSPGKIANIYHLNGQAELAAHFDRQVTQHYPRSSMLIERAQNRKDDSELPQLVQEMEKFITTTLGCIGECGDKYCNPERDARAVAIVAAELHASQGDTRQARALLNEFSTDPLFPSERLRAHLALYKAEGLLADREEIITLLGEAGFHDEALLKRTLSAMASADLQYGQSLPSFDADGEVLPLIVLEAGKALSGEKVGLDDPLWEEASHDATIKRSVGFAALAVWLAENNAPVSAGHTVKKIEDPQRRVGGRTALARIYGADFSAA